MKNWLLLTEVNELNWQRLLLEFVLQYWAQWVKYLGRCFLGAHEGQLVMNPARYPLRPPVKPSQRLLLEGVLLKLVIRILRKCWVYKCRVRRPPV